MKLLFALLLISTTALCQTAESTKTKPQKADSVIVLLAPREQELLQQSQQSMKNLDAEYAKAIEAIQNDYAKAISMMIFLKGKDVTKVNWQSFRVVKGKFIWLEKE